MVKPHKYAEQLTAELDLKLLILITLFLHRTILEPVEVDNTVLLLCIREKLKVKMHIFRITIFC